MIGYLKGKIIELDGHSAIIASDAVGYAVHLPSAPKYAALAGRENIELFVHTHVREDAIELFGFLSRSEKELFLTFLAVNGVGPKAALNLLSQESPGALIDAILAQDRAVLTQIPGVGKKTAERILLEVTDPLRKKLEAGRFADLATTPRSTASTSTARASDGTPISNDARLALVDLGFKEADVVGVLSAITREGERLSVEQLIRKALQRLNPKRQAWPTNEL